MQFILSVFNKFVFFFIFHRIVYIQWGFSWWFILSVWQSNVLLLRCCVGKWYIDETCIWLSSRNWYWNVYRVCLNGTDSSLSNCSCQLFLRVARTRVGKSTVDQCFQFLVIETFSALAQLLIHNSGSCVCCSKCFPLFFRRVNEPILVANMSFFYWYRSLSDYSCCFSLGFFSYFFCFLLDCMICFCFLDLIIFLRYNLCDL